MFSLTASFSCCQGNSERYYALMTTEPFSQTPAKLSKLVTGYLLSTDQHANLLSYYETY